MAKQVKVFNGVISSSGAIYTVPAGRVAKVTIGSLAINGLTVTASSFSVGGIQVVFASTNSSQTPAKTSDFNASFGTTINLLSPGAGQKSAIRGVTNPILIDSEFYIQAGDTVSFSSPGSSGNCRYSFSAVEEF